MGEEFPIRTLEGTAVGALIGLLGGPIGLAVGAVAGTFAGGVWDMSRAGVNADFLDEVSAKLTPGKWAIVSEISEDWITPVDTQNGSDWRHSISHGQNKCSNMINTPRM